MKKEKLSSYAGLCLKIILISGVFYWLAKKDLISLDAFREGLGHPQLLLAGSFTLFITTLLGSIRWQILLRTQGILLPFLRTIQLHFIGNFFNVALPGAVSGDFVKAFYIAKEAPGARGRAFGCILFDRILGISALVLVSVGALAFQYESFVGSAMLNGVKAFIMISGICVVAFYSYLFSVRESWDPILKILTRLEKTHEKLGSLVRVYMGIRVYHSEKLVVLKTLAISILIHLGAGFACIQFAYALSQNHLHPSEIYVVAPLGLLVTAVPILPGGIGTGHAAFSFFFKLIDSNRGADVFSFFLITQLAIGALGGLVYLRFKAKNPEISAQLSHSLSES